MRSLRKRRKTPPIPWRTMVMADDFYAKLDPGIRFAVRVLHARGLETCQSCQGGQDPDRPDRGHAYDRPTVEMIAGASDALGFAAVAALVDYGLPVRDVAIVWHIANGLPYEKLWRITFWTTMEDRADDTTTFVYGAQAQ